MAAAETQEQMLLAKMRVPDVERAFVLGSFERRVTIHSQQLRAFNLVYCLWKEQLIKTSGKIAVIGGGAAGLTAAAAAASLGCRVDLFEKKDSLMALQRGCVKRPLHPNIFDWPKPLSKTAETSLPFLNWKAGAAETVRQEILEDWKSLVRDFRTADGGSLITLIQRTATDVEKKGDGAVMVTSVKPLQYDQYDVAIIAVGFGPEKPFGSVRPIDYWRDTWFEQSPSESERPTRVLISGTGDGALIDFFRFRLEDFKLENVVTEFFSGSGVAQLATSLLEIEKRMLSAGISDPNEFLFNEYQSIVIPSDLRSSVERRLRNDNRVVLHSSSRRMYNPNAALLHRALLLVLSRVDTNLEEYWGEAIDDRNVYINADGTGTVVRFGDKQVFDLIIVRHGPKSSLQAQMPKVYERAKDKLATLAEIDFTRTPLFSNDVFKRPSPKQGGGGSGRLPVTGLRRPFLVTSLVQTLAGWIGVPGTEYRTRLSGALDVLLKQRVGGQAYEHTICLGSHATRLTPEDLMDNTSWRAVRIAAGAGTGKSVFLTMLAEAAIRRGNGGPIPFPIDLRLVDPTLLDTTSFDLVGLVRQFPSIAQEFDSVVFERTLALSRPMLILVDALNEIGGSADAVVAACIDALRTNPAARVVVADRLGSGGASWDQFQEATLNPLTPEQIRSQVGALVLDDAALQILGNPFILDLHQKIWRGANSRSCLSPSKLIETFYSDVIGLSDQQVKAVGKVVFEGYGRFRTTVFDAAWWTQALDEATRSLLQHNGVTRLRSRSGGRTDIEFSHQLLQEFLVGRVLASTERDEWDSQLFDVATFDGASLESLSFAANFLGPLADSFIIALYDWNYGAAFATVTALEEAAAASPVSGELKTILAAVFAEKQFDFFPSTSTKARKALRSLQWPQIESIVQAESLTALIAAVDEMLVTEERREWKRLFVSENLSAADFARASARLSDSDPLTAWTAANVLRRFSPLPDALQHQLRTEYFQNVNVPDRDTFRWRVVHVLGATSSAENIRLLEAATFTDLYVWARYGAVRSLLECAARGDDLRTIAEVADALATRMAELSNAARQEVRRCTFVKNPPASWFSSMVRVADAGEAISRTFDERLEWNRYRRELQQRGV